VEEEPLPQEVLMAAIDGCSVVLFGCPVARNLKCIKCDTFVLACLVMYRRTPVSAVYCGPKKFGKLKK
jgi:hypothetical protein